MIALAALLALSASARDARAGVTIDLLFVGINGVPIAPTNTVDPDPLLGSNPIQLTMAVVLRNDEPLTVAVFSLNYDLDLDNELDVVSVFQWRGVAINKTASDFFFAPLGLLDPSTATFVGSFGGVSSNLSLPRVLPPAAGPFASGYQMGTVTWKVQGGVNNDGADIISGLLNPGVDAFAGASFNDLNASVLFNAATVNLGDTIPEPATAALLGLGVAGLALLRRRGRGSR